MQQFQPVTLWRDCRAGSPVSCAPAATGRKQQLRLPDLSSVGSEPTVPAAVSEPVDDARPERRLLFDEAELARACAAAAAAAASAAATEARARAVDSDGLIRAELERAVAGLDRDLAERRSASSRALHRLVALALGALLPRLREARLAVAIERILENAAAQPLPAAVVLHVPRRSYDALAARIPALLAEAGLERPCEVVPHDSGDELVRLTCGDFWSELDAAAWADAVTERLVAALSEPVASCHRDDGD